MIEYIEIGQDLSGNKIFGRVDEDGLIRVTCTQDNPDYQAWLNPKAEQFTPIVKDEPAVKK